MLYLLRREVISETLTAHIAKLFDIGPAANRLRKKLLIQIVITAQIPMFVQRKTDTAIADPNTELAKSLKKGPAIVREVYGDMIQELKSPSDLESEDPQWKRSSTRRSKIRHALREDCQFKRHSH